MTRPAIEILDEIIESATAQVFSNGIPQYMTTNYHQWNRLIPELRQAIEAMEKQIDACHSHIGPSFHRIISKL